MTSLPNTSYLSVLGLVMVATTVVEAVLADRRRGGEPTDWSSPLALVGTVVGILFFAIYTALVFVLPAIFVAWLAWKFTFPSIDAMGGLAEAETVMQLAAFFAIAAHFADLISTYGRANFRRHVGQFLVVVPTAYYLTIAATWLLTSIPSLRGDTWRLLKLPVLAPGAGLNRLLVLLLFLGTTVTSYWLRKRGEERGMPADRALSAA